MSASDQEAPGAFIGPGVVLGKCEIQRELGRGGMGTVYLAQHRTLDVLVAVKVLSPEVARVSPLAVERFLREARLTARIRHPNLVGVMDTDTDPATGASYLVMEFVDGPSVYGLLSAGPMDPGQVARIALGVARALEAAHLHKVVHRDVKPANILVASDGTVKLTDLGLAKDMDFQGKLTASSATLGTPLYMSPEQVRKGAVDIRTDVYSLGVAMFEMLTGQPPFTGTSFFDIAERITTSPRPDPRDWSAPVDEALAGIVMRAMARSPDDRYATPAELSRALGHYLGETPADGALMRVSGGTTGKHKAVLPPAARASAAPRASGVRASAETLPPGPPPASVPPTPPPGTAPRSHQSMLIVGAVLFTALVVLLIARPDLFRVRGDPRQEWAPPAGHR